MKLTASQKFQYLKSALAGEAASLMKHLTISDANNRQAWEELQCQYHKPKSITEAYLKAILEFPVLPPTPSSAILRKLLFTIREAVRGLAALQQPTDAWDCWLVYVVANKLDGETKQLWLRATATTTNPTFRQLVEFIDNRDYELHAAATTTKKATAPKHCNGPKQVYFLQLSNCSFCDERHVNYKCPSFLALNTSERNPTQQEGLCQNCLRSGHVIQNCRSGSCRVCEKRHHTLIHDESCEAPSRPLVSLHTDTEPSLGSVLLPTAIVLVEDFYKNWQPCRALLYSGSQVSPITENCVQNLKLPRSSSGVVVSGIGSKISLKSRGQLNLTKGSRYTDDKIELNAVILSKLSLMLPRDNGRYVNWNRTDFKPLNLADENYARPSTIDIILGADVVFKTLRPEQISHASGLHAQNTMLGYVIAGPSQTDLENSNTTSLHVTNDSDACLQRFWELDTVDTTKILTQDEILAENHYALTHERQEDGCYIVELPFRSDAKPLGNSESAALRCLYMTEKAFKHDTSYKEAYCEFIREYEELGHNETQNEVECETYYIPHHAVFKESSTTTKLRVVFNASKPTSTGVSLNCNLLVGPVIQDDITVILIRFRAHPVALTGARCKMYRMIKDKTRKYQRILFRYDPRDNVQIRELSTFVYGTSPAPFLATRTLKQLADDERVNNSLGAQILENDFYVDDAMTGAKTPSDAINCVQELTSILKAGGFEICKWSSNSKEVMESRET